MPEFLVVTGLSGAGRSETTKHLEDLGWFVIDNLPPSLMPKVSELAQAPGSTIDRVALVMRTTAYREEITDALRNLRAEGDGSVRMLFLEARTPVLVRRYETTRHRHPFENDTRLADSIEAERVAMDPIKAEADVVIDTSDTNVHQLRDRLLELFGEDVNTEKMQIRVLSFGFKHGLPLDVDMVFDCRFLPNPHWVEELRPQTGVDAPVRDYVMAQDATGPFLDQIHSMLELLVPEFIREGKAYLTVAFGCTGGHHRSVAISEAVAIQLRGLGHEPGITHRDIER